MYPIAEQLHSLLKNNIVAFTFRKKDGTIRKAKGTRNLTIASAVGCNVPTPTHGEQPNSYYDIDRDAWRSYIPANVISIDCVFPSLSAMVAEVYGNEKPQPKEPREIPISKGGIAVELPPSFGSGTAEKIRKAVEELGKDIDIPIGGGFGMPMGGGSPMGGGKMPNAPIAPTPTPTHMGGGKVGQPTDVGYGMALPISGVGGKEMTIDDFAKLVAKYVVAELAERLSK